MKILFQYTREYDWGGWNDEIIKFPAIWMEQKGSMFNEISQKRSKQNMISLICVFRNTY